MTKRITNGGNNQARRLRPSSVQRFVLKEMMGRASIIHLQPNYNRTRHALQRQGLIVFEEALGRYKVTDAGVAALGPRGWAVDVFESRDGAYGRRHVATQLFFTEWEARNYSRANCCELLNTRNWSEVREATANEKEFA